MRRGRREAVETRVSAAQATEIKYTYQDVLSTRLRIVLQVQAHKMLGKPAVKLFVDIVENQIEQVETRNEGWREIQVLRDCLIPIILGADGIGSGQDRRASIQCRDDPGLGDRNSLLFLRKQPAETPHDARSREKTYHDLM